MDYKLCTDLQEQSSFVEVKFHHLPHTRPLQTQAKHGAEQVYSERYDSKDGRSRRNATKKAVAAPPLG